MDPAAYDNAVVEALPAGSVVAVGMSGGVDSSVAALLLRDAGVEVLGVTAIMTREESKCCSPEDVNRARVVADRLGFEHHVVDVVGEFEKGVIDYFLREYLAGRTPSPCVRCNRLIKFGAMPAGIRNLGVTHVATGHYARVVRNAAGVTELRRGREAAKEQSYFLASLSQEQLACTVLPLGSRTKAEIVAIAHERGLVTRAGRESQDLCFVPDGNHGHWIDARLAAGRPSPGPPASDRPLPRGRGDWRVSTSPLGGGRSDAGGPGEGRGVTWPAPGSGSDALPASAA